MNKREYAQANKDWLEAKSKEEGIKALNRTSWNSIESPNVTFSMSKA